MQESLVKAAKTLKPCVGTLMPSTPGLRFVAILVGVARNHEAAVAERRPRWVFCFMFLRPRRGQVLACDLGQGSTVPAVRHGFKVSISAAGVPPPGGVALEFAIPTILGESSQSRCVIDVRLR